MSLAGLGGEQFAAGQLDVAVGCPSPIGVAVPPVGGGYVNRVEAGQLFDASHEPNVWAFAPALFVEYWAAAGHKAAYLGKGVVEFVAGTSHTRRGTGTSRPAECTGG